MLRMLRIREVDPNISCRDKRTPKMYTRLTDNLWLLKKLLRYLYIYLPKLMDLSPIASNYRSSWIWNTYDIHAICDVYGEFVPPHLSLVLILQCTWSSAESINQLGQWKSQGHLHYSSWPTTMAQTNLRWKHWFYGWSCKSIIWHWKSWRS